MNNSNTTVRGQARTVANKVLKNTYILLSMTLLFSAFAALTSYMLNISVNRLYSGLYFVALYLTAKIKIMLLEFSGFVLLVFLDYTRANINIYVNNLSNTEIVATSLMMTGIIFLSLSAYVNLTKKDFSFIGGLLHLG